MSTYEKSINKEGQINDGMYEFSDELPSSFFGY